MIGYCAPLFYGLFILAVMNYFAQNKDELLDEVDQAHRNTMNTMSGMSNEEDQFKVPLGKEIDDNRMFLDVPEQVAFRNQKLHDNIQNLISYNNSQKSSHTFFKKDVNIKK